MTSSDMSDPFALRSWSANLIHTDDDDAIGWWFYALIVHVDGYDPLDLFDEIASVVCVTPLVCTPDEYS